MNELDRLLNAAGGEAANTPALNRWRQAIGRALAALSPSYVLATRTGTPQTIADLAAATTVLFNTETTQYGNIVSFSPLTGEFRLLQPGHYELDARLFCEGFDTVATDFATFFWEDSLGNDLAQGALALVLPADSGQNFSTQPTIKALVHATSPMTVKVVSAGGQGGCDIGVGAFATVRKIG